MVEAFPSKLVGVFQEFEEVDLQQTQREHNDHLKHHKVVLSA